MANRIIIRTEGLSVELDSQTVLEEINLEVYPGEMVGIIGPNGAGKTTFLRLLLGLIGSYRGTVEVLGRVPKALGEKREDIGYLPQRPRITPRFPLSVRDVVSMGLVTPRKMGRPLGRQCRRLARESLEKVGLLSLENRNFERLSGGEQQRVFLARALIKEPQLLMLDEPNAGLDLPTQNRFMALLKDLQEEQNLTVILVSHDLAALAGYANRLVCINRTMHVHGNTAEVMKSPRLGEAYRCEYELLFGQDKGKNEVDK